MCMNNRCACMCVHAYVCECMHTGVYTCVVLMHTCECRCVDVPVRLHMSVHLSVCICELGVNMGTHTCGGSYLKHFCVADAT